MADRTAQDLLVQEQIAFLLQQQFEHMNANKGEGDNSDDYFRWQRHIEDIHDQYREARDKEDAKGKYEKATKEEREYAAKVGENIAKALPAISKGIISAKAAFEKGDYATGTAAIMDICAAVAPVISSLLSAAGPEGMLVGALFSVVGQILTLFGKKEPSELSKIETLLKDLENERQLQTIRAVHDEVRAHASTLIGQAIDLGRALAKPLTTVKPFDDYTAILLALKETKIVLKDDAGLDKSVASFNGWSVLEYLKSEVYQDVAKWPEVLALYCKTYSDLVTATMSIRLIANNNDMRRWQSFARPDNNTSPLEPDQKATLLNALLNVQAYSDVRRKEYESSNAVVLPALKELTSAARARGLFAFLGTDHNVSTATGKAARSGSWGRTYIGYGDRGHAFSISAPREDADSLTPQYHVWLCEYWLASDSGDVVHVRIDPSSMAISDGYMVSPAKFSDVWAVPDLRDKNQDRSFVYCAHDGGGSGYMKLFEVDANKNWTPVNWQPATKSGMVNVRVVTHPPTTLPDDPDKGSMLPGSPLLKGDGHDGSIHYGGLHSSSDIYVVHLNDYGYVPVPSSWPAYTGIDVDPYYLWVFTPTGFACATHASVIGCRQGKRTAPRWMEYGISGDVLGDQSSTGADNIWIVDGREQKGRPPLKGQISLSPCKDGTLLASIYNRTIKREGTGFGGHFEFTATDTLGTYTSVYSIDVKAGTISVDPWVKVDGSACQVQKMAIPCWSLLESLKADLKKPVS